MFRSEPGLRTIKVGARGDDFPSVALPGSMLRAALAAALLAAPAAGEIYQWTDSQGRVHFTQDLSQVPPGERAAAEARARTPAPSRVQTFAAPESRSGRRSPRHGRSLQIPFERRGTLMLVHARLNDSLVAPFLVDTGASHVSIPRALADRLGLRIGPDTPRVPIQTANGLVAEPVVRLESVQVGEARIEALQAFVSSSMEVGLLGGAFFNNFVYQVDAAAGVIQLRPNARVRGGLTESQWRGRFQALLGPIAAIDAHLEGGPFREQQLREIEARRRDLMAALEVLEGEANTAQVPHAWRR